jgi:hypothetical protein
MGSPGATVFQVTLHALRRPAYSLNANASQTFAMELGFKRGGKLNMTVLQLDGLVVSRQGGDGQGHWWYQTQTIMGELQDR